MIIIAQLAGSGTAFVTASVPSLYPARKRNRLERQDVAGSGHHDTPGKFVGIERCIGIRQEGTIRYRRQRQKLSEAIDIEFIFDVLDAKIGEPRLCTKSLS